MSFLQTLNKGRRLFISVAAVLLLMFGMLAVAVPSPAEARSSGHTVTIKVDGSTRQLVTKHTKAHSVLHDAGIQLGHHDEFRMSTPHIADGTVITVYRAVAVQLEAHGKTHDLMSGAPTVGELLEKHGYSLTHYSSNPDPATPLKAGMFIKVETLAQHKARLEEEQRLALERQLAAARNPGEGYVETEQGYLPYTEHYVMEGTAYHPSDGSGTGYTAMGIPARHGVVAVDPDVIELGTRVFIPGYGIAVAADTGGAINGMVIDVCMDSYDECFEFGCRDVDVYVLAN